MKVSVITPLFNYRDYIQDNIKSFLNQNFNSAELIIVDDASSDNPTEVIKKFKDDRIKYIRLDKNYGYSYAKNVGIKAAKAKHIVMLDADDMLTENGIKVRYKKIIQGYDFVHGPVLDLRGDKLKRSKLWKEWKRSNKDASCYRLVHSQGVMLRRDVHARVGLYDVLLRCKSDREMWARIFNRKLKVGWVEEDVAIYRRHKRQMHRSREKMKINDRLQAEVLRLIAKRRRDLSGLDILRL